MVLRPEGSARAAPKLSEDAFQARILEYCAWRDLLAFHDQDSRRNVAGFPDLVVVGTRVLFRELKTDVGKLRPEQVVWVARLSAAGADVDVWRPRDWPRVVAELEALR